jgi:hypothetical protein
MYNFLGTIIYLYIGFFLATTLSISPIPALIGLLCILTPLFMKAKIIDPSNPNKELKDDATYGFGSSIVGLIESKLDIFMFIFCVFTTYATYKNSTDIKAPIFVALASIWFLYQTMKHKYPPRLSTENLVSYDRNEKYCPEKKPTKAEMDELERDNEDDDVRDKEAYEDSFFGKVIKFWATLPKTIYDSLFGPDKPCPVGGNNIPATATATATANTPATASAPVTSTPSRPAISPLSTPTLSTPLTPPSPEPVTTQESFPQREQQGGRTKGDHLLRKMKKLTDTLKRRGK